mmetsp:Transcript_38904/g.120149  ORF Transcript_38904/g.120149 Transcript_38904/m.120149 type:complete len:378 (-) Transcript_38904:127-1260(-)
MRAPLRPLLRSSVRPLLRAGQAVRRRRRRAGGRRRRPRPDQGLLQAGVPRAHLPDEGVQEVVRELREHEHAGRHGLLLVRELGELVAVARQVLLVHEDLPGQLLHAGEAQQQAEVGPGRGDEGLAQAVPAGHAARGALAPGDEPLLDDVVHEDHGGEAMEEVDEGKVAHDVVGEAHVPREVVRRHDPELADVELPVRGVRTCNAAQPQQRHKAIQSPQWSSRQAWQAKKFLVLRFEPEEVAEFASVPEQDRQSCARHARPIVPLVIRSSALTIPCLVQTEKAEWLLRKVEHGIVGQEAPAQPGSEHQIHCQGGNEKAWHSHQVQHPIHGAGLGVENSPAQRAVHVRDVDKHFQGKLPEEGHVICWNSPGERDDDKRQ